MPRSPSTAFNGPSSSARYCSLSRLFRNCRCRRFFSASSCQRGSLSIELNTFSQYAIALGREIPRRGESAIAGELRGDALLAPRRHVAVRPGHTARRSDAEHAHRSGLQMRHRHGRARGCDIDMPAEHGEQRFAGRFEHDRSHLLHVDARGLQHDRRREMIGAARGGDSDTDGAGILPEAFDEFLAARDG